MHTEHSELQKGDEKEEGEHEEAIGSAGGRVAACCVSHACPPEHDGQQRGHRRPECGWTCKCVVSLFSAKVQVLAWMQMWMLDTEAV